MKLCVYIFTIIWLFAPVLGKAQGLCDSPDALANQFSLPAEIGCAPFAVEPTNRSTWTEVQYIFDYRGQPASQLSNLNPAQQDVLFAGTDGSARSYTILQFGKDATGKQRYSCKQVRVRANLKPNFSYTVCNAVTVNIPEIPENDFDNYVIEWSDNTRTNVLASQLPFEITKNIPLPGSITVRGEYTNTSIACPQPNRIDIPQYIPSNFPNGYDKPFHPNIDSLIQEGNTLQVHLSGAQSSDGYTLNWYERNKPLQLQSIRNVQPGNLEVELPEKEKSYCFFAIRTISCGIEQSAEVCTAPILELNQEPSSNTLIWTSPKTNQFIFPNSPQFGRFQETRQKLLVFQKDQRVNEISLANNQNEYQIDSDCKQDFCYQLEVSTNGSLFYHRFNGTILSEKVCTSNKIANPIEELIASYNLDDNKEIRFEDDSPWPLEKEWFYLWNATKDVLLDSLHVSEPKRFTVNSPDSCFTITFKDICENRSSHSPEVCLVQLQQDANKLIWTNSLPFSKDEIESYAIYAKNETTDTYEFLETVDNQTFIHSPDLESFNLEALFKIQILSKKDKESWSNAISIPLETRLVIPNAFSPNNDGSNDLFQIKGSLARIKNFSFTIMDRNGWEVWRTDDPKEAWDGRNKFNSILPGLYFYSIHLSDMENQFSKFQGSFLLLL